MNDLDLTIYVLIVIETSTGIYILALLQNFFHKWIHWSYCNDIHCIPPPASLLAMIN